MALMVSQQVRASPCTELTTVGHAVAQTQIALVATAVHPQVPDRKLAPV